MMSSIPASTQGLEKTPMDRQQLGEKRQFIKEML